MSEPLTDYERWELSALAQSQIVGEQVMVARRSDVGETGGDFWLFDHVLSSARLVLMRYAASGRWVGADLVTDPGLIEESAARLRAAERVSVPLNEYPATLHS